MGKLFRLKLIFKIQVGLNISYLWGDIFLIFQFQLYFTEQFNNSN